SSGAAGAHSDADRPLDHLDVAKTPADYQFIEFGQSLANINPVTVAALVAVDGQNGLGARLEPLFISRDRPQFGHHSERRQGVEEYVAQRRLAQTPFELGMHLRRRLVITQHLFVLQAAQEFYLTKLL